MVVPLKRPSHIRTNKSRILAFAAAATIIAVLFCIIHTAQNCRPEFDNDSIMPALVSDDYTQQMDELMALVEDDFAEIDVDEASIPELKDSAESGNALASYTLGRYYLLGHDYEEAVKWMELPSAEGYPYAQAILSFYYMDKDAEKAFELAERAADLDNDVGQYLLGVYYEQGVGVAADYKEAVKWYELAAAQGDEEAQEALDTVFRQYSRQPE